jgi:hypothetical protein
MSSELDDLDVSETLAAAGESTADIHRAEVRALEVDLHFASLHGDDPQAGRGPRPSLAQALGSGMTRDAWEAAGNKLVQLGGDGTPMVQDLPLSELAVARGIHEHAARGRVADVLDLAFRLPGYWDALRGRRGEVWVGRKVARMSRHLDRDQVREVDAAVTKAVDESPGRVLAIAEAAVLRADPEHGLRVEEERRRRRYVAIGRADEDGLRSVFARIAAGDAVWLEAMIERIADALEERPDLVACGTRDELRAEGFGWLAHPEDVIALLNGTYGLDNDAEERKPTRARAVLHAHISQEAVDRLLSGTGEGVVLRVEELGPMLLATYGALIARADIELKPVIDLNQGRSVNQYEHPADVQERGLLRTTGDVFPHSQRQSRRFDSDHPDPYDPHGPPGQTGDHNHAPLGRRGHRAKTHLGYRVWQLGLNRYLWRTPHGLWRVVDGSGTHVID